MFTGKGRRGEMHVFTVKKGKFRIVKNAIQDLDRKNQKYKNHKKIYNFCNSLMINLYLK